ncbi:MAG: glycosyltransferase family 4 protein [Myxococcota bacterium]|nr:glycosyltransferase family 4 protein [Myxococcota bacterium]
MSSALRVLVLNERDPRHPRAGGAEVHVAEISKRLAERGFELTQLACSFPGSRAVERVDGMTVRRLGGLAAYYPRVVALTARETRARRYDVVVEHLNKVPFCARAYAAAPVVAVNHHLFGESAFLQVPWPIAVGVLTIEKLVPSVYRGVPFLAVSESSRQDLVARGVPAGQIELLHNGITLPSLEPKPVGDRPLRLAYLGRLEPYKRVDLLLRATARLAAELPDLDLVIVGRGSERARLEALAGELGIARRVRFTGFVSDVERDATLAEARVCVCPSVKEGWGITVIEANALGIPVIATDAPGLRDAVRDDETGVLVADGPAAAFVERLTGALRSLLGDRARLGRFAEAAVAWSQRFDWDRSADEMAGALQRAAEPVRAGASAPRTA